MDLEVKGRKVHVPAASMGAAYAGVIFAGGPRERTPEQAAEIWNPLPSPVRRVGVFGRDVALHVNGALGQQGALGMGLGQALGAHGYDLLGVALFSLMAIMLYRIGTRSSDGA